MIRFAVNQKSGKKIADSFWVRCLKEIQVSLKLKGNQEISIALVSDQEIKKFNRIYRRKNQVTDVLSFSQQDSCLKYPLKSGQYLGEIIIGYPQAKRQAKIAKNSLNQELKLLLTHGFLHLLGYNHQKSSQAKVMQRLEDKIIAGQGIISRR